MRTTMVGLEEASSYFEITDNVPIIAPYDGKFLISTLHDDGSAHQMVVELRKGDYVDHLPVQTINDKRKAALADPLATLPVERPACLPADLGIVTTDRFVGNDWKVELIAVVLVTEPMTEGDPDAVKAYLVNELRGALAAHVADSDLADDYVLGDRLEETLDWGEDAPDGARLRLTQIWSTLWRRVTS